MLRLLSDTKLTKNIPEQIIRIYLSGDLPQLENRVF